MMYRCLAIVFLLFACGPRSDKEPAGTHGDPVDTCTRAGDVCKLDNARLGVCTSSLTGAEISCQSQH